MTYSMIYQSAGKLLQQQTTIDEHVTIESQRSKSTSEEPISSEESLPELSRKDSGRSLKIREWFLNTPSIPTGSFFRRRTNVVSSKLHRLSCTDRVASTELHRPLERSSIEKKNQSDH